MGAALAIFSGPYALLAKWGVIMLLAGAVGVAGWVKGNAHGTAKLDAYIGKQATESIKVITRQGEATERVVTRYVQVKGKTKVVTETIEKEVTKYVESKPLALACVLDNRWLRLHDAAATGAVPPPAAGDDAGPGGVTAAAALPGVTANYARASRNADRLAFCQDWVREQFKATNGKALEY
jgi:hypothetical protein